MRIPAPVAIVGGGWLGSALAMALPKPVVVTTRSGRWRDGAPPPGVKVVALDVTGSLDVAALRGCKALVIAVATGKRGATSQERRALWVDGIERLLQATKPNRWQRVVFIGSTSALPDLDGWIDERATAMPSHERGRVQREAEQVVATHCEREAIPWWVLRMGGLYGPGRQLGAIYAARDHGRDRILPGDGNTPTNLTHRDDAVASIEAALAARPALEGIVHVVDDDHTTRRQMYAAVAAALGVEPVAWAEPLDPRAPPRGKRVGNLALKTLLRVRLQHPTHRIRTEVGS